MWSLVEEWTSQNFLLAASICHAGGEAEHRRPDGLIEQHAYSVLTSISVGDLQLIKLRNPWGSDAEWRGAWSDNSDLWQRHANIAQALDFRKAADGIFWMDWHDFSATFNSLEVSHKRMRTGPGESNRAAWRSLQRARAGDQPAPQTPNPRTTPIPNSSPPGWEMKYDSSSGKPFYVNHATKTTQWKPPTNNALSTGAPQTLDEKQQISEAIALSLQEQQISAIIALSIHELGAANARPPPAGAAPPLSLPPHPLPHPALAPRSYTPMPPSFSAPSTGPRVRMARSKIDNKSGGTSTGR
jgi:hypothetical protein